MPRGGRTAAAPARPIEALDLTDVSSRHRPTVDRAGVSELEKRYLDAAQEWQPSQGADGLMQSTKPMTAAYGLTDSPAGLAAWIVEKLRAWSDCDGAGRTAGRRGSTRGRRSAVCRAPPLRRSGLSISGLGAR